jgi:membrane-bound serine protease (ClpP class)
MTNRKPLAVTPWLCWLALLWLLALGQLALAQAPARSVVQSGRPNQGLIVKISGEINGALANFLERRIREAEDNNASVLVLAIDTPGGEVSAAMKMSDAILASSVPTVAVVTNAFSAGALIAMSAEHLAMLPGSEIGAALPITGLGQAIEGVVGEKINSALRGKFRSVAETRSRNANVAEGMVNPNQVIPGLKEKGEIITLTASQAVKHNIADSEATTLASAVQNAGFAKVLLRASDLTPAEQLGQFLSLPLVAALLLAIGIIGIGIELLHPGWALPGVVGVVALLAYFGGSWLAGNGNTVAFLLFVAGILLLAAEILVIPGFGVVGIAGIGSILVSIYLSFGDQFVLVSGITVSLVGVGLALALWLLPRSAMTRRFALATSLESGTSQPDGRSQLVGRFGKAATDLRPGGVAEIEGQRVDVIAAEGFVVRGTMLEVLRVEGPSIIVRVVRG